MPDIHRLRADFPLLDQTANGKPLAYLDNAATSQKPRPVIDAVNEFLLQDNANVHRGLYDLARRATDAYENARVRLGRFINAPSPDEVIWVRGTTEAINLVASSWGGANLQPGDEIIVTMLEHHSNIVPWQLVAERTGAVIRWVDIDEQGRLVLEEYDRLLNERTKLVAVGHVSNALGTINPVHAIIEKAHAAGALVLVDGAQAAPHLPVDVQALDCDFYALSGHKMCGPMGIGVLWARRELLDAMPPYQGGGEMIESVSMECSTWARVPHKFEAGTPNAAGAVGMAAACDYIDGIGHDALLAWEHELARHAMDRLSQVEGIRLFGPENLEERLAVFSFALEGVHPHDIATVLDAEGIAVRAGHHCAGPLMTRLGVPATARASFYLYNTTEEIDRLAAALITARELFAIG
ncbi:MAG TPA: cysteine desulfurase [Longimicrobiales bacterium]|nr:cysteine desulfurase [Longimicrobiales bacterium]